MFNYTIQKTIVPIILKARPSSIPTKWCKQIGKSFSTVTSNKSSPITIGAGIGLNSNICKISNGYLSTIKRQGRQMDRMSFGKSLAHTRFYSTPATPQETSEVTDFVTSALPPVSGPSTEQLAELAASGVWPKNTGFERLLDFSHYDSFTDPFFFLIEGCIEAIQMATGFPWWASVMALSVIVRLAFAPFVFQQMRTSAQMKALEPTRAQIERKITRENPDMTQAQLRYAIQAEFNELLKVNNIRPFAGLKTMIPQTIIYSGAFFVFRHIANGGSPLSIAFTNSSFLWVQNLCLADPTYLLPVLSASFVALSFIQTMWSRFNPRTLVMIGVGVGSLMAGASFWLPSILQIFWMGSGLAGIAVTYLGTLPFVRRYYKIDDTTVSFTTASNTSAGHGSGIHPKNIPRKPASTASEPAFTASSSNTTNTDSISSDKSKTSHATTSTSSPSHHGRHPPKRKHHNQNNGK